MRTSFIAAAAAAFLAAMTCPVATAISLQGADFKEDKAKHIAEGKDLKDLPGTLEYRHDQDDKTAKELRSSVAQKSKWENERKDRTIDELTPN